MENEIPTDQLRRGIEHVLGHAAGDRVNIVFHVYRVICSAPEAERPGLLQFTADRFDTVESSEQERVEQVIPRNEQEDLERKYGAVVDAILNSLIRENPEETEFYRRLWVAINSPFLPDDRARAFALYYVLIDVKIPYFQVGAGLRMADEDFSDRSRSLQRSIAKVRFLLRRQFSQKTERADLLLRHISEREDPCDRAVLMAALIHFAGRGARRPGQAEE